VFFIRQPKLRAAKAVGKNTNHKVTQTGPGHGIA